MLMERKSVRKFLKERKSIRKFLKEILYVPVGGGSKGNSLRTSSRKFLKEVLKEMFMFVARKSLRKFL